jgi:hypothetical protein
MRATRAHTSRCATQNRYGPPHHPIHPIGDIEHTWGDTSMSYSAPPPPDASGAYGGGYAQPKTNSKAVWALVLGIVGLVCCGFFAGIPALILGNSAKKEIAASGGAQSGEGMAQAGVVLGIIAIVLGVLGIILLLAGVIAMPSSTSTSP